MSVAGSGGWAPLATAKSSEVVTADVVLVAMTRKVVRSNMTTSVAPHASANVVRCFASTVAFGIKVCTIRDHA